jgi:hypothetical protein
LQEKYDLLFKELGQKAITIKMEDIRSVVKPP